MDSNSISTETPVTEGRAAADGRAASHLLDLLPDPTSTEMRELCEQEKTAIGNDCFNAGWYQAFAWLQGRLHKSNVLGSGDGEGEISK